MSFIAKGGSRYDMIYDTCSWEVDMIYDTCSWRPLYVEAQHGIRTLYGGVTRFGCLTLLLWKLRLMPLKNKRHKGTVIGVENTRAVRLQVDRWQQVQRLLLLRELHYLRVGAEWFVCCGVCRG